MHPNGSKPRSLYLAILLTAGLAASVLAAPAAGAAEPADWTDTKPPKLDQDYWFEAVDPLSADNAWAAGVAYREQVDDGVLAHWKDGRWSHEYLRNVPLFDISALPDDEVWSVGYDYSAWQPVAVHGSDGEVTTTPILPPDSEARQQPYGVAAIASDDVWVAGTGSGTAFVSHWDGQEWSKQDIPIPDGASQSFLNSITATPDGQVWAAGTVKFGDGTSRAWMPRFDGDTWSDTPVPAAGDTVLGVFDIAANGSQVWAGGLQVPPSAADDNPLLMRWDGKAWVEVDTGITNGIVQGVSPDGSGGAYIVGHDNQYQPLLLRYRDGEVTAEPSPVQGDIVRLMDVAAEPAFTNMWIAGDHKTPDFVKGAGLYKPLDPA